MKKICETIYREMLDDIGHCKNKRLFIVTEIESCFHIVANYWGLLKERVSNYEFENTSDEIEFFKNQKPLFTSLVLYYELLYHLELFIPEKRDQQINLLIREKRRLEKFVWCNSDFYEYYKTGDTSKDELYFVRANCEMSLYLNPISYCTEENATTSHDYLVAQILALEPYNKYVEEKLRELEDGYRLPVTGY